MDNMADYFTLSELAKEFDVEKSDIRFCEEKGLISPRVIKLGRRVYNKYDRARLKMIMHCVLIGYSQKQVVELIGMPDAGLGKDAQIRNGIEYGENKLEELENRKVDLSFHKRTGIMSEINMMRKYLEEIKSIKPESVKKHVLRPQVQAEKKEKKMPEALSVKPKPEKTPLPKPAKMTPVYISAFVLALIIAGYFYYQTSQKRTQTIRLAQKEQAVPETHRVYRESIPVDNTDNLPAMSQQTPETPADVKVSQDSLKEKSTKFHPIAVGQEQTVKTGAIGEPIKQAKSLEKETASEKQATVSLGSDVTAIKTQKKVLTPSDKIALLSDKVSSTAPEKITPGKQTRYISKTGLNESSKNEKSAVKTVKKISHVPLEKTPLPEVSKVGKTPLSKAQVKEEPKSELDTKSPLPLASSAAPSLNRKTIVPKAQQTVENKVKQETGGQDLMPSAVPSVSADETLTTAASKVEKTPLPKSQVEEAPEIKTLTKSPLPPSTSAPLLSRKTVVSETQQAVEDKVKQGTGEQGPMTTAVSSTPADEPPPAVAPEIKAEPLPKTEVEKAPKPETTVPGTLVPDDVSSVSEKKTVTEDKLDIEKAMPVPTGDELPAETSETEKQSILKTKIKESTTTEPGAQSDPGVDKSSFSALSQNPAHQEVRQSLAAKSEKNLDLETSAVKSRSATSASERSTKAVPEIEKEQKLVATKEKTVKKEIQVDRLKSFLDVYCKTYEDQDLDKYFAFFTSDATENDRPVQELIPVYQKNKADIDSLKYRIKLIAYSKQADTGNIMIQGRFSIQQLSLEGTLTINSGDISMELVEHGDSFLVKQVDFGK